MKGKKSSLYEVIKVVLVLNCSLINNRISDFSFLILLNIKGLYFVLPLTYFSKVSKKIVPDQRHKCIAVQT